MSWINNKWRRWFKEIDEDTHNLKLSSTKNDEKESFSSYEIAWLGYNLIETPDGVNRYKLGEIHDEHDHYDIKGSSELLKAKIEIPFNLMMITMKLKFYNIAEETIEICIYKFEEEWFHVVFYLTDVLLNFEAAGHYPTIGTTNVLKMCFFECDGFAGLKKLLSVIWLEYPTSTPGWGPYPWASLLEEKEMIKLLKQ